MVHFKCCIINVKYMVGAKKDGEEFGERDPEFHARLVQRAADSILDPANRAELEVKFVNAKQEVRIAVVRTLKERMERDKEILARLDELQPTTETK